MTDSAAREKHVAATRCDRREFLNVYEVGRAKHAETIVVAGTDGTGE